MFGCLGILFVGRKINCIYLVVFIAAQPSLRFHFFSDLIRLWPFNKLKYSYPYDNLALELFALALQIAQET